MEKSMPGQTAVGVIDADKKITPKYYQTFELQAQAGTLTLKKHRDRPHYLILIAPALEKFIEACAHEVGIGLPCPPDRLKEICKTQKASNDLAFKAFLNQVIQKQPTGMLTIKHWLADILPLPF